MVVGGQNYGGLLWLLNRESFGHLRWVATDIARVERQVGTHKLIRESERLTVLRPSPGFGWALHKLDGYTH